MSSMLKCAPGWIVVIGMFRSPQVDGAIDLLCFVAVQLEIFEFELPAPCEIPACVEQADEVVLVQAQVVLEIDERAEADCSAVLRFAVTLDRAHIAPALYDTSASVNMGCSGTHSPHVSAACGAR